MRAEIKTSEDYILMLISIYIRGSAFNADLGKIIPNLVFLSSSLRKLHIRPPGRWRCEGGDQRD